MTAKSWGLLIFLVLVSGVLEACGGDARLVPSPTPISPTAGWPSASPTLAAPTATYLPASPTLPPATSTHPAAGCSLGTGLRKETAPILVAYREHAGLVMASSSQLAEVYFPQLEGWTRVLGAPSLAGLQQKAERAEQAGVPYDALGYGLETSKTTPVEEWRDLVGSTQDARALVDHYGKLLAMGPGFRLMSQNEDKYPQMAGLADIWVLQTQRLQVNPPGSVYRQEVERIIDLIKSGNPNISIWAQITLPPDREPNVDEWLAYRQSIVDLVDGTYIGAYTWESTDPEQLSATIEAIFTAVCGGERRAR